MKCPKCHYLSFEPEPRCRNCGFSFSLADDTDVLIRDQDAAPGVFADLDLRPPAAALDLEPEFPPPTPRSRAAAADVMPASPPAPPAIASPSIASASIGSRSSPSVSSGLPSAPISGAISAATAPGRSAPTTELPLFVKALTAAEPDPPAAPNEPLAPLVKVPADPRPPLSVRRKSEPGSRAKVSSTTADKKLGPFDRDLLDDLRRIEQREDGGAGLKSARQGDDEETSGVGAGARAAAAAVDAVLLGATATAVLWMTLRWCDLPLERIAVLPAAPTGAFLAIVGAGYLLMFTAFGGQTLGKMALGIRVVSAEDGPMTNVSVRQALYRAVLTLPSVLVFGLGFVPALLGDRRAVHDRLAHTRVVRA